MQRLRKRIVRAILSNVVSALAVISVRVAPIVMRIEHWFISLPMLAIRLGPIEAYRRLRFLRKVASSAGLNSVYALSQATVDTISSADAHGRAGVAAAMCVLSRDRRPLMIIFSNRTLLGPRKELARVALHEAMHAVLAPYRLEIAYEEALLRTVLGSPGYVPGVERTPAAKWLCEYLLNSPLKKLTVEFTKSERCQLLRSPGPKNKIDLLPIEVKRRIKKKK